MKERFQNIATTFRHSRKRTTVEHTAHNHNHTHAHEQHSSHEHGHHDIVSEEEIIRDLTEGAEDHEHGACGHIHHHTPKLEQGMSKRQKAKVIATTALRLLACPGDDIAAIAGNIASQVVYHLDNEQEEHQAVEEKAILTSGPTIGFIERKKNQRPLTINLPLSRDVPQTPILPAGQPYPLEYVTMQVDPQLKRERQKRKGRKLTSEELQQNHLQLLANHADKHLRAWAANKLESTQEVQHNHHEHQHDTQPAQPKKQHGVKTAAIATTVVVLGGGIFLGTKQISNNELPPPATVSHGQEPNEIPPKEKNYSQTNISSTNISIQEVTVQPHDTIWELQATTMTTAGCQVNSQQIINQLPKLAEVNPTINDLNRIHPQQQVNVLVFDSTTCLPRQ